MAEHSAIEWTGGTWNVVTGCTKVSPGCAHCYIERTPPFRIQGRRFERVGNEETTGVRLHPERLDPSHKLYPTRLADPIFVCSLADLFHDAVPDDFLLRVFDVIERTPGRTFQVLTKRPERARSWVYEQWCDSLPPNVWMGVSIENARYTWRADILREIPAAVRFISAEPLLGSLFKYKPGLEVLVRRRAEDLALIEAEPKHAREIARRWGIDPGPLRKREAHQVRANRALAECLRRRLSKRAPFPLDLTGIDWVIVGGESGPGSRPMDVGWARELVAACRAAGVAPFVKQLGARPIAPQVGFRAETGQPFDAMPLDLDDRKGGDPSEWPPDLRIREFPRPRAVPA